MSMKKTIAEQIAELNNPASLADPEDDFNYDTQARVVPEGTDDGTDDFTAGGEYSFQAGSIRRQASSLLEEKDSRYKGKRTSRKELEQDSEDDHDDDDDEEEDSDEEDHGTESLQEDSDDEDFAAFRELIKKDKQTSQRLAHPATEGHKNEDSDEEEKEKNGDIEDKEEEDDEENMEQDSDEIEDIYKGKSWKQFETKETDEGSEFDGSDEDDSEFDGSDEDDSEEEALDEKIEEEKDSDIASKEDEMSDVEVVSKVNLDEEIQKGMAAKNQQGLWDNFLEARIKLQKALQMSNQLPQYSTHHNLMQLGDEELIEGATAGRRKLKKLLKVLVDLQDELLMRNSETRHIVTGEKQEHKGEGSDEEITSEDEDEKKPGDDMKMRGSLKRKVDLSNPGDELAKRHKQFEKYRNTVIYTWYDKTKLASGKLNTKSFRSFEKSPVEQVEQIMMEKNRLIHRTQMKRSVYRVIGQREGSNQEEKQGNSDEENEEIPNVSRSTQLHDIDPEIFDDDDFYHQLLKELIERKTADTTDPAQLTRQWLAVQKLRSKIKRVVDTRASKGRKLRYDVHPKMVSFMAPRDESTMTDDARNELFRSLFGQTSLSEQTVT